MVLKKIKQYYQDHGLKPLFIKIKTEICLKVQIWVNRNIKKEISVKEVLSAALPLEDPLMPLKVERTAYRLNLVIDQIPNVKPHLILAALFANKHNIPLRIISRSTQNRPDLFFDYLKLQNVARPQKVEFFSDFDRAFSLRTKLLETSDKDIYLTTIPCSTIQFVNFRKHFKFENLKNAFPYTPGIRKSHPKLKLVFFARPNEPQYLFHKGLRLLDEALLRGILSKDEWEIYFVGDKTPALVFSIGLKPKTLGNLDGEGYLEFIQNIDLGFSLLNTFESNIHALEVASMGGIALTNSTCDDSDNIIVAELDSEPMMQGFQKAVTLVKNLDQRQKNHAKSQIASDWMHTLKQPLHYMEEHVFQKKI